MEKQTYKVSHCNKGCDLIDIGEHSKLSDQVGCDDSISRFVAIFGSLAKNRESRKKVISSQRLQKFGGSNDTH